MTRDICIDRLCQKAKFYGKEIAYYYKENEKFKGISWENYHEQIRKCAKSFIKNGLKKDSKIAILSFGRIEWVISAVAAQYMGSICVGIYTTSAEEDIKYIVNHSDSEILFIENKDRFNRQIMPIINELKNIKLFVVMNDDKIEGENIVSFSDFLLMGQDVLDEELDIYFNKVDPKSPCTMIYTSGTTGHPKAVMLSHYSVAFMVRVATQMWKIGFYDKNISYLPLAHVAEQMFTVYAPIDCGMKTYFSSSFDALRKELVEVEPTIFFAVPRVFEKMYEAINDRIKEKSLFLKLLLKFFLDKNIKYHQEKNIGNNINLMQNIGHIIGKKIIFDKLKKQLGLSKVRACFSGAAPISKEILNFFLGLDVQIYELYGLSETTGPCSINTHLQTKIGSVGHAVPGTKIAIADDGEILINGPHVFLGYYKNEEATKEAIKDGWFYTGDIGHIDNDGFLFITDRKKDLLITAGGKNISPQNLESLLKSLPYVQSAVVIGDKRKFLCALLSPNKEILSKKAKELGESDEKIIYNKYIHDEIKNELEKLNRKLSPVEQIKKYSLLENEFSVDSGEFTPTLKIKRKYINEKYKDKIEELYQN